MKPGLRLPHRNDAMRAWLTGIALGAGGGAGAQTAASPPDQIERVTVTAEKRETVLEMTPDAISVLDGRKLQERGQSGLADIANLAPNVNFTTMFGSSQLFIRGIGNVFITAGGDPGVALYTDGAYVSDMTSANTSAFDVQRVEVLRGPQGALYGRNATGGAVDIISAPPTDSFRARASVLFGDYGRRESEGFASGPLGDSGTRVRLSYEVKKLDGFTSNPLAGQTFPPVLPSGHSTTAPTRLDDQNLYALRLQTQSDLGGAGSLRLIANHFHQHDNGQPNPVLLDPTPLIPELLFGVKPSSDPRSVKSGGGYRHIDVDSLQAIYDLPVGDKFLTVVASTRHSHSDYFTDGDTTEASMATTRFDTHGRDTSVDAHFATGDDAPLQWLVGATALNFVQRQDIDVPTLIPLGFLSPGQPLNVPVPFEFLLGGTVRTRSAAAYADLHYALTPTLGLLGGLRFSHESKRADEYNTLVSPFNFPARTASPGASWSSAPWSLGLQWQATPDLLTYAKAAHGFKSGAINVGAIQSPVKPETVLGLELGAKLNLLDRRASLAVALFASRYKDMQVVQTGQASPILGNAGGARISGLEVEALLKPMPSITLGANIGLMDPKYTDFVNTDLRHAPMGPAVNTAGNQLANVSKAQATLSADWAPVMGDWCGDLRAEYVWRDRYYFTEFNTADAKQDAFGMLNLSFTLRPAQGHWRIYGYLKNVSNVTAFGAMNITSPLLGAPRTVNYLPPRHLGIGISYDF